MKYAKNAKPGSRRSKTTEGSNGHKPRLAEFFDLETRTLRVADWLKGLPVCQGLGAAELNELAEACRREISLGRCDLGQIRGLVKETFGKDKTAQFRMAWRDLMATFSKQECESRARRARLNEGVLRRSDRWVDEWSQEYLREHGLQASFNPRVLARWGNPAPSEAQSRCAFMILSVGLEEYLDARLKPLWWFCPAWNPPDMRPKAVEAAELAACHSDELAEKMIHAFDLELQGMAAEPQAAAPTESRGPGPLPLPRGRGTAKLKNRQRNRNYQ